ncbi:binding-protein-dependent transport system inner membrane protein [Pseudomonas sp. BAY1663]|nr:binding-protein-dependent transport system inner membrane protein [Pseudomonas sp. BAY1663]
MSPLLLERLWQGLLDTLLMVGVSSLLALLAGIPLAVFLVTSSKDGIFEAPRLNRVLGGIVNLFRSIPFLILMVALIPFTRLVVGTTYGVWAAVVPLTIAATPFFARIAEVSLREVDHGLIEPPRPWAAGAATSSGTCCCPRPCPASSAASPSPW